MTLTNLHKTPWPWFGGKSAAAELVWDAIGDAEHYVEPFAGSLAVMLRRPHRCNRTYHSETVNDLDGLLVNAWRAMAADPQAMADAASWPVSEADLHARHLALLAWRDAGNLERLMGSPDFYDAKMAGWWAWGQSCWIGSGWCDGTGGWSVGDDGRIRRTPKGGTRERGVSRKLPHLTHDGKGVNRPQAREPGVGDYHPMTMPELLRWFQFLSARLRHVRILNGDWARTCTGGAAKTLGVRMGDGHCGIFFDPPYSTAAGRASLYTEESFSVADDVREWCEKNGDDPRYRIVLAGYEVEHASLEVKGWRVIEWFRKGFLTGGMKNTGNNETQQTRERLWLSPHCIDRSADAQGSLFGEDK